MCDISIILVNYKNKYLTEDCINSILNSNCKLSYEIIVIDNNSEDDSVQYLKNKFSKIKIKNSGRNGGFAYGNNKGVEISNGKYLMLLNNDTTVYQNIFDELVYLMKNNPQIGLLGCRSINGDGIELPVSHSYENLKRLWLQTYIKPILEKLNIQRKLVSFVKKRDVDDSEVSFCDWIAGSAMLISKQLYKSLGGLDENFFMYMEDEDLCHRVNDAGYLVGVYNKVGYVHLCGGSTIQSVFLTEEYFKSRLLFFKRYDTNNFETIKKALYKQIRVVNKQLTKEQIRDMKYRLESYIKNELNSTSSNIRSIYSNK